MDDPANPREAATAPITGAREPTGLRHAPSPDAAQSRASNQAHERAVAALAAYLPAANLADLLGIHINTAVRWVTYVRRDWADYLAAERCRPIGDE